MVNENDPVMDLILKRRKINIKNTRVYEASVTGFCMDLILKRRKINIKNTRVYEASVTGFYKNNLKRKMKS